MIRQNPAMPWGITYMNTIRKVPKMAQGLPWNVWAQFQDELDEQRPDHRPEMVASPRHDPVRR
jgi:hypothetical protein